MTKSANTTDTTKTWNLDDIVTLDEFPALLKHAYSQIDELAKFFAEKMSPDMSEKDFKKFLELDDEYTENLHRLDARVSLMESTDTKDQLALKLKSQVKDLFLYTTEKLQAISLWLQGQVVDGKEKLDDNNSKRLFEVDRELTYVLTYARSLAGHSLDVQSESIMSAKNSNGISVINDLRDIITTEFQFEF